MVPPAEQAAEGREFAVARRTEVRGQGQKSRLISPTEVVRGSIVVEEASFTAAYKAGSGL